MVGSRLSKGGTTVDRSDFGDLSGLFAVNKTSAYRLLSRLRGPHPILLAQVTRVLNPRGEIREDWKDIVACNGIPTL